MVKLFLWKLFRKLFLWKLFGKLRFKAKILYFEARSLAHLKWGFSSSVAFAWPEFFERFEGLKRNTFRRRRRDVRSCHQRDFLKPICVRRMGRCTRLDWQKWAALNTTQICVVDRLNSTKMRAAYPVPHKSHCSKAKDGIDGHRWNADWTFAFSGSGWPRSGDCWLGRGFFSAWPNCTIYVVIDLPVTSRNFARDDAESCRCRRLWVDNASLQDFVEDFASCRATVNSSVESIHGGSLAGAQYRHQTEKKQ